MSDKKKHFTKLPPRYKQDQPLCFNCHLYGHVSKFCTKPKKPKCGNCGKYGHEEAQCRKKTEFQETLVSCVLPNNNNDKYFFEGTIEHKPIKCYVDQGSQCCLMRHSDVNELGLKMSPIPKKIRG